MSEGFRLGGCFCLDTHTIVCILDIQDLAHCPFGERVRYGSQCHILCASVA